MSKGQHVALVCVGLVAVGTILASFQGTVSVAEQTYSYTTTMPAVRLPSGSGAASSLAVYNVLLCPDPKF